jgi:hypothetical protein
MPQSGQRTDYFFDEADCLPEGPLLTILSQIRDGYNERSGDPGSEFPRSLALAKMRNIKDYKTKVSPDENSRGTASPFNIFEESLTLANFTIEEIRILYNQHTQAAGQGFDSQAVAQAWYWSEGQPWLVNALAKEAAVKILKGNYSVSVSGARIDLGCRKSNETPGHPY